MTDPTAPGWLTQLVALLGDPDQPASGAELHVTHPDGTDALVAPLARHHRFEPASTPDGLPTVWLRPIPLGHRPAGATATRFGLADTPRRALTFTTVTVGGDGLHFELWNGQRAHIRPISADLHRRLEAWDTFVLTVLSATEEEQLEQLEEDSWWGPNA